VGGRELPGLGLGRLRLGVWVMGEVGGGGW